MSQEPVHEQWYWPFHTLSNRAANQIGKQEAPAQTLYESFDRESEPLLFMGQKPTARLKRLVPKEQFPKSEFTVELWIKDHVNQAIGCLLSIKDEYQVKAPTWVLGYYEDRVQFFLNSSEDALFPLSNEGTHLSAEKWRSYKRYFSHLVATFDGDSAKLYVNGELKAQAYHPGKVPYPQNAEWEAAAYLQNEPHMRLGDILLYSSLWDKALSKSEITQKYQQLQEMVDSGKLYPEGFHFVGGPYLHYATQNSVSLTWETDVPSTAVIEYGTDLQELRSLLIEEAQSIHTVALEGLNPETRYYYRIRALEERNLAANSEAEIPELNSGVLTFSTARKDSSAYSFAVLGDTEARPHINAQIGQRIWEERPDFMLNLGDLTDGGRERHKFEWNYEYFLGMTPLNSRIPVFPVPGNGEGDLYWYKKYHQLPNGEAYYSFTYGNAEFFMLNSNNKEELAPGGEQYVWLEEQLKSSTATWKFACHHHPVYTSDEDDYGNTWKGESSDLGDLKVRELVQLYEKYGVDMVFYGHLHTYERTWPLMDQSPTIEKGVVYLVSGGAGGNLEDFAPTRSWFSTKLYRGHHYCKLDVFQNKLYFKMYDISGAMKDYFELTK